MFSIFSIQYIFLRIFYCLNIVSHSHSYQFNLYHTIYQSNGFERNCLYYFISNELTVPQFIKYCIHSSLDEVQSTKSLHYDQSFTFKELRDQNISSYQLYLWSAPIDLIELYQIYLEKNLSTSDFTFYNCTYPWFGSHCEYTFGRDRAHLSFAQQVEFSFAEKENDDHFPEIVPCYIYLMCHRVGDHNQIEGACLDWREVCDGKINCLNNYNDEEHCWQLEINECDPQTEFRCHNGLCIPLTFLNDDIHNPDCLDRSDEYVYSYSAETTERDNIPPMCHKNPAFKCEEHTWRLQRIAEERFECGDGTHEAGWLSSCANGRHKVLMKAMFMAVKAPNTCLLAFECVTGLQSFYHDIYVFDELCILDYDEYNMTIKQDYKKIAIDVVIVKKKSL